MIPTLHSPDDTELSTLGIGALTDCSRCEVSEELNGQYTMELDYPIDGQRYSDIGLGSIIMAIPSPYRRPQPFYIYEMDGTMAGTATFYAKHISQRLDGYVMPPFRATGITQAINALNTMSIPAHGFSIGADGITDENIVVASDIPIALDQAMELVREAYSADWLYDGRSCTLLQTRGKQSGVKIQYGKNLTGLKQTASSADMVAGLVPYWSKKDADGNTNTVTGHLASTGAKGKVIPLDLSAEFNEQPTVDQLNEAAALKLADQITAPETSLDVQFIALSDTLEYKDYKILEQCDIGDIVLVSHKAMGVETADRVEKVVTNVLLNRYKSITVGRLMPALTEYLKQLIGGLK